MRFFGRILLVLLLSSCAALAKADPVDDFRMDVLDPPTGNFTDITTTSFTFNFGLCPTLPPGNTADGCFVADNGTGADIVGIAFSVPNSGGVVGQPAACGGGGQGEIFSTTVCPVNPGQSGTYDLIFSGGVITQGEFFIIAESGVPPGDFPTVTANLTLASPTAVSPEPSSLLLLATGLLALGSLLWSARLRATW